MNRLIGGVTAIMGLIGILFNSRFLKAFCGDPGQVIWSESCGLKFEAIMYTPYLLLFAGLAMTQSNKVSNRE
jgi:hypothetical protein